jgi:hypothetical protein
MSDKENGAAILERANDLGTDSNNELESLL